MVEKHDRHIWEAISIIRGYFQIFWVLSFIDLQATYLGRFLLSLLLYYWRVWSLVLKNGWPATLSSRLKL